MTLSRTTLWVCAAVLSVLNVAAWLWLEAHGASLNRTLVAVAGIIVLIVCGFNFYVMAKFSTRSRLELLTGTQTGGALGGAIMIAWAFGLSSVMMLFVYTVAAASFVSLLINVRNLWPRGR